jgi:hypothetical protein
MSDKLRELFDKITCYDYQVQNCGNNFRVFKFSRHVTIGDIRPKIKLLFGSGYTKLFNLQEIKSGRFSFVEISDR